MGIRRMILLIVVMQSCAILQEPTISKKGSIDDYQFVVIPETGSLSSSTGGVYGNQYGTYGGTTSKSINPGSVIEGYFLKRGILSVDEVRPEHVEKTLIVKYGQGGKRFVAGGLGGYTLEVTILVLDAQTMSVIYSCTAEGQGSTEADDIREAIDRCLSKL